MQLAVTAWDLSNTDALKSIPDQAVIAEDMGFSGFWLPENHFIGTASLASPLLLLAAAAAKTKTIRLGTTSYLLPIRNPVEAAEDVATLDCISNGRLILGIGRGFNDNLFEIYNIDPKQKRSIFKQHLEIMIQAWQGYPLREPAGKEPVYLSPRPIQKPYPEIWVAAFGPLALKQAASFGLPYLASPMESLPRLIANMGIYNQALSLTKHADVQTIPIMRTIFISDNKSLNEEVTANLETEARQRSNQLLTDLEPSYLVGNSQSVRNSLQQYKDKISMNYLIARGRIRGVSIKDQLTSHQRLLEITQDWRS
ncbi:MAG: LLM class flavin-dependent oxidoreductase [Pseudomonadota bacterium]|nr:LLM class flavin-dependent oxidoreductase [Pseudomonadota bacterium]